ncbi:hypothetical protein HOE67_00510 [Candidatus Peregrinibacteria bacterium]|jgi:hypothetical protein|nr:hypothetical protein [Candidatus Peregrinibacteria bacterium]MBT4055571.1 hypothetical protein [Candidatus Peregrinibacteria bacterium]
MNNRFVVGVMVIFGLALIGCTGGSQKCLDQYGVYGDPSEVYLSYVDDFTGVEMKIPSDRAFMAGFFEETPVVVGAIGLDEGEVSTVGTLAKSADINFEEPSRMFLREVLVNYVSTFDHLNASLCIVDEINDDEQYVATFDAEHSYCTNDCYTDEYGFQVKVDKVSREVMVIGM